MFAPEALAIDETVFLGQITLAAQQAFNLSVNAAYPTAQTTGAILAKAVREARSLGIEAGVYEKDIIDAIIGKAYRSSLALKELVEVTKCKI